MITVGRKVSTYLSRITLAAAVALTAVGCKSKTAEQPPQADTLPQAKLEMLNQGDQLINEGEDLQAQGKKLQAEGKDGAALIRQGDAKIAEGTAMKQNAKKMK